MANKKLSNALQGISDHIDKLTYVLSMCDPRIDFGSGMECQFCRAKDKEAHKPECIYETLTKKW